MSIFSRMTDIVQSNLSNLLERAEDPAKMVRLMIQEMEDTLVEVRSGTVSLLANKKELERKIDSLRTRAADWASKAELAVTKAREDLAKLAILAKKDAEEEADELSKQLEALSETVALHHEDVQKLENKLTEAKAREKMLLARVRSAEHRAKAGAQVQQSKVQDMLNRFEETERIVERAESRAEQWRVQEKTLEDEFHALEQEDYLNNELKKIKQKQSNKDNHVEAGS